MTVGVSKSQTCSDHTNEVQMCGSVVEWLWSSSAFGSGALVVVVVVVEVVVVVVVVVEQHWW